MRYEKGKLERRKSLGEGKREKKEKMEVHGSLAFIFIKLLMPYNYSEQKKISPSKIDLPAKR